MWEFARSKVCPFDAVVKVFSNVSDWLFVDSGAEFGGFGEIGNFGKKKELLHCSH